MIDVLVVLLVAAFAFAYGWFLRSKYSPPVREGMNKYKQKFLLWYVRREIKKFDKYGETRRAKIEWSTNYASNHKLGSEERVAEHAGRLRLTQLFKWEYSLATINKGFGEDVTHRNESPKFASRMFAEPTPEQWDKYRAKAKAETDASEKKYKTKKLARSKKLNGRTSK